jgi:phosphopantothenoylcysteine decarboxylase/phosphopantothenate--cysteine ligase
MRLSGKQIVVGVGGGIAAFKAVALVRELQRRGASVRVAMTRSADALHRAHDVQRLDRAIPAVVDLWDAAYPGEVHVELSMWAHAVVVAPATANLLARAAAGMADDAVLACLSCATGRPLLLAPSDARTNVVGPGDAEKRSAARARWSDPGRPGPGCAGQR